jgi:hypothetical protein
MIVFRGTVHACNKERYPPPPRIRKAELIPGIVLVLTTSACGVLTPPNEDQPACQVGECDGVRVGCDNQSSAARNYWWKTAEKDGSGTYTCPGDMVCDMQEPPWKQCWCKTFTEPKAVSDMGDVCVGLGNPTGGADPLEDWQSLQGGTGGPPGHYPDTDADQHIRNDCSRLCGDVVSSKAAIAHGGVPKCDASDWSGHRTEPSWDPDQKENCLMPNNLNADDPNGSDVPWDLVGGPSSPVPLPCALDGSCAGLFYPAVDGFVFPGIADFIEPETRHAHYLGVDGSGSELTLDPGQGSPDTEPLFGIAEYTTIDCKQMTGAPSDVCPFYLANLIAYNTSSSWNVRLEMVTGPPRNKEISNVQIDLLQSTFGIHHKGLDKVAFAPGALRLRVEFEVDGNQSLGNGTHIHVVENEDYVFADYDDGDFVISHEFPLQNGTATLSVSVVADEHPPTAAHDLQATEPCDVYQSSPHGGLLLDESRSFSSDPDDDIVSEFWLVDGTPCGHGCVVPMGTHTVALEVHDARGAAHRTPDHSITVEPAPACIPT